ncbi:MAG: ATP phosphoribosyltransferase, partial [Gammaproteobacteria bacterium]
MPNDVQFVFLRPTDIARNVGAGVLDGPHGVAACVADLDGKRVATSFSAPVTQAAAKAGIHVELVELDGAVETAVELGLADAIADVVETGVSLQAAGLHTIGEPIMHSEAVLVRGANSTLAPASEQ